MNVRNQRRWKQGCCASCGYPRSHNAEGDVYQCQECGNALNPPDHYQLTLRTVRRFVWILALGWILGVFVGEIWVRIDETSFENEVLVRPMTDQSRQRVWPGWGTLTYKHGEFSSR